MRALGVKLLSNSSPTPLTSNLQITFTSDPLCDPRGMTVQV